MTIELPPPAPMPALSPSDLKRLHAQAKAAKKLAEVEELVRIMNNPKYCAMTKLRATTKLFDIAYGKVRRR